MGTILIIDDEPAIRKTLAMGLERNGHSTLVAKNGRQAMEVMESQPVDLVITDIVMPEQEGLETIRRVREGYPDVIIFAMSGMGEISLYLKMARSLGALRTFAKPVSIELLREEIRQVLPDGTG